MGYGPNAYTTAINASDNNLRWLTKSATVREINAQPLKPRASDIIRSATLFMGIR